MAVTPLPAHSIINVQMFGHNSNQTIINLFQYRVEETPTPTVQYTDYLNSFEAELAAALRLEEMFLGALPDTYTLDFVRLQPVYPTRLRFVDYTKGLTGLLVHGAPTANLAASIERYGVTGRRHGIGRVQLVMPEGVYSNGEIDDNAYFNELLDLAQEMKSDVSVVAAGTIANYQPVIINVAEPNPTTVFITGTNVKRSVRVMRRRTVGLGI